MCFAKFFRLSLFRKNKNITKEFKCPKCNKVMNKLIKYDILIEVCPKCKGMWLDDKEIDALLNLYKKKNKEVKNGKK